jgi:hypothetical protein
VDPVPFPAVRPFEVWFVPDDGVALPERVPLRVGQRLLHYDDAVALADTVARELPAYGLHHGHVLVTWSSSILKVLNTVRVTTSLSDFSTRPVRTRFDVPHRETIYLVLEDLQQLTRQSDPSEEAPPEWVERLHAVLRVIASSEDQVRFRLGGGQRVTMDVLHRRVAGVRYLVDRLTTQSAVRRARSAKVVPFARGAD